MPTRRIFLKQASLASGLLILKPSGLFKKKQLIGLQLYTLRKEIAADLKGTIGKVAAIGYNSVELFGYGNGKFFGLTPEDFSAILKDNGLVTPSGHYMMGDFLTKGDENQLKSTIADAAKMGHTFFTIPYLQDNMRTSLDDYKKLAEKLNIAGTAVKAAGMRLTYHNHDFEFKAWGGETGFDVFTKETDPALVSFEMDMYWVTKAGKNPADLIAQYPGRFKMWHIKDMDSTPEKFFTEVGSGIIDYKSIFKLKKESGMEFFFVEQDQTRIPVYDSITKSFNYIKSSIVG